MKLGTGFALPESVRELEIPQSDVSPEAAAKLQPMLEQCLQLGFHSPRCYRHETLGRGICTHFISMLHRSGQFTLRLMHTQSRNVSPPVENVLAVLLSELKDGTYFFTSDQRPRFAEPPAILSIRLVGEGLPKLIRSHEEKLAQLVLRNPPKLVQSQQALEEVWDRYEQVVLDFQLRRGLYVPMAPGEVDGRQKLTKAAEAMTDSGVRHAEVLVELGELQNRRTGWGNDIMILVVSMLLFVGAGSCQWSWDFVVILVPVLFVHELGHYIAMRAFRYRNLRMFFIPFFGAAVAGQHYNVPGWNKVVVSLMGPVPGIFLGAVIGGVGLIVDQPLLIEIALVSLILNGINLLPVLPLDGGWVFHTLIFSRHHLLDAAFRVVASIALIAGGSRLDDKILMFLGVLMALGIPTAYRLARMTTTLRQSGVAAASPDDQSISQETAIAIIDELKKGSPQVQTNKTLAQQTLQIFETLNARPPGWLGTVSLLFVYFTTLGMAVVFASIFIVGQGGGFRSLLDAGGAQPQRPLACGTIPSWNEQQAAVPLTIIAHFPNQTEAQQGFQRLTNRLPESAAAKVFGDSVFLTIPAGEDGLRKQWFDELESQTKVVFVDGSNAPSTLSISCEFSTEKLANEVEEELTGYLSANLTHTLIPPWQHSDDRDPNQRAGHQIARQSFVKAQTGRWKEARNKEMNDLQKQMRKARREGDEAATASLGKQIESLSSALVKQRLEKLKAGEEGPVDPEMIELFTLWSVGSAATNLAANEKLLGDMAKRMGQLPIVEGAVAAAANRFSARSGYASSEGRRLQLSWASFRRISDGAPALVDWLCMRGGTGFTYDIVPRTSSIEDEEE
ncbi:MAG: site-2 protease family protein [Verrucomicrobia bacterium]|nr:site-2 protease family protein [Verrucomicrobiota bacterium]